ncbi:alkyl hydroperoxide reductase [uncultured Microscilla sp.]|uniref:alkyl hydroperoxide reductase n=1 Tax=uncultured Microscilla sp. TaxID=432653 RepID=UPI00262B8109|nr:alkyl hydroperoxide reductase [uncultured Microscilla sp.]
MQERSFPKWMTTMLRMAAIYNILWGAWVTLFPFHFFDLAHLPRPNYAAIWQAVGMIVGCYGIAYWVASYNPYKHWGIVLVGFLGKVFGPIGFLQHVMQGSLPWVFGLHNITNDLVWLVPFGLVLYGAYKQYKQASGKIKEVA